MNRMFPEIAAGGYSRVDQTVDFYGRVNALLAPDSAVVDFGAGLGGFMDLPDSYIRRLRSFQGHQRRVIGVDVDPIVKENQSVDEAQVWEPGNPIDLPDASVDVVGLHVRAHRRPDTGHPRARSHRQARRLGLRADQQSLELHRQRGHDDSVRCTCLSFARPRREPDSHAKPVAPSRLAGCEELS